MKEVLAAHAHYAQIELLRTRLRAEMEEDIRARQDKFRRRQGKDTRRPRNEGGTYESL
jgi:hypothetical protein